MGRPSQDGSPGSATATGPPTWPASPSLAEVIDYASKSHNLDDDALRGEIADAREGGNGGESLQKLRLAILLVLPGPDYAPAESARISREVLESGSVPEPHKAFAEMWAVAAGQQADLVTRYGQAIDALDAERATTKKLRSQLEALKRIEMQSSGNGATGGEQVEP